MRQFRLTATMVFAALLLIVGSAQATIHTISLANNFFAPTGTTVNHGDTVRWVWVGGLPHSSVSDVSSAKAWASAVSSAAGFTFEIEIIAADGPGPFPYHCGIHTFTMFDTIFVAAAGPDTDSDGLTDAEEAILGTDPGNPDTDGDTVPDLTEVTEGGGTVGSPANTDGDGLMDALDTDDDNDGILTIVEVLVGDTDSDGIADYLDEDDDGDGVLSWIEFLNGDSDTDGIDDYLDVDDDDDGILTEDELPNGNTDGDGFPDYLDDDDDNDGVPTISDNCPLVVNPGQEDLNTNGIGDVCETGCCDLAGDFTNDGAVNISDLTATVDFMFRGGPAASCLDETDVNSDCTANISDLTYRVDFMFRGGPPLTCGCVGP